MVTLLLASTSTPLFPFLCQDTYTTIKIVTKDPDIFFVLLLLPGEPLSLPLALLLYTTCLQYGHFGIMQIDSEPVSSASGLYVLAYNSGGPTESIVNNSPTARGGWL